MHAKNVAFENIKKLMGWCPNARSHETQHSLHPEYFDANIPTRGGDTGNSENLSWFRKVSNRILLIDSFLTLIYLAMTRLDVNISALLAGFIISVTFVGFDWKRQMHRNDIIAQKLVLDNSDMKKLFHADMKKLFRRINPIFYVMLFYWIFYWISSGDVERNYSLQVAFSFVGGLLMGMWLSYFQLIYWEKKNHKTIYFDKSYGTWKKSYIIRERK
ncbi:hypothetical protein MSSAC_4312 [Methanosarcina siciliae C2J]|uniref:DUF1673 domain-containing protein n=1 Tax=Methanosarcina siciliae C2J TaxID=1434118 RepID=A0A0E3PRX4_9EURY|nr:DUF1673 domain-containing protein [Methanosarcina siciliae]AKB38902.1 hypothetical protein MSSAC_4312 [Methanosarcina siciliae C2J]